jgi:hypothetical protein
LTFVGQLVIGRSNNSGFLIWKISVFKFKLYLSKNDPEERVLKLCNLKCERIYPQQQQQQQRNTTPQQQHRFSPQQQQQQRFSQQQQQQFSKMTISPNRTSATSPSVSFYSKKLNSNLNGLERL